jgi:hypothetical protein
MNTRREARGEHLVRTRNQLLGTAPEIMIFNTETPVGGHIDRKDFHVREGQRLDPPQTRQCTLSKLTLVARRGWVGQCFAVVAWLIAAEAHADEVASAIYVRTDSDQTTVISPRARVNKSLSATTSVDVTYAADVWTSASIDIRASASKRVIEQRDELDIGATHALNDITLNGGYRFSTENDYTSHGLNGGASYDFADNSATLAVASYLFLDRVGRSGDPDFDKSITVFGGRIAFTQVLDPMSLIQLIYEPAYSGGYQASPYRFVGVGGSGDGCIGAVLCLPEHVPTTRLRHGMSIQARRAFGDVFSAGATYRFYIDDWGLSSNTVMLQGAINATHDLNLTLRYRYYTQGAADFYKAIYPAPLVATDLTTRDRELSPLSYHRIALEVGQTVPVFNDAARLLFATSIGGTFYHYEDFVGLVDTSALELTFSATLEQ